MGSCDQRPSFYAANGYLMAHVRVESPFDYLGTVRDEMRTSLTAASVPENTPYESSKVILGSRAIRTRLNGIASSLNLPLTINVVIAKIENCHADATPPTLDIVYTAFTSWFPFYFTRTFETRNTEAQDPATAAGQPSKHFQFVPQVGYNATSKLFGGARASLLTSAGTLEAEGTASTSATSFDATDSFTHTWSNSFIRSAEWRTGVRYDDTPTDAGRIKQVRITTQFAADSAPLGSTNASLRFGGALSGGHDQSDLSNATLPAGSPLSNPFGELKTYAGISGRTGRHSFKFSYGLQLGEAQTGAHVDFAKHIVDGAYNFRILPWSHRSIDLDTRLTAGWIQNLGAIPVAERFFGGNHDQDFLLGDSWRIRSAPFIRSIPQNRLSRLAPNAPIGGENFVSGNLTLGLTTWHRPLLPSEIGNNADFQQMLSGQMNSAQKTLASYWVSKDPAVPETLTLATEAVAAVRDLRKQFDGVSKKMPRKLSDRADECDGQISLAEGFADDLDPANPQSKRFNAISFLVAKADDGSIDNLTACINDLRSVLGTPFSDDMIDRLNKIQTPVRRARTNLNQSVADMKATRDMAFVRQTVNTLIQEINFASVSPIAIFDVARIGPQTSAAGGGVRFGIGGGVRLTLLDTIRFDAGYAFNPNPKPWEGRGAAFFALEIVSLFR